MNPHHPPDDLRQKLHDVAHALVMLELDQPARLPEPLEQDQTRPSPAQPSSPAHTCTKGAPKALYRADHDVTGVPDHDQGSAAEHRPSAGPGRADGGASGQIQLGQLTA